MILMTLLSIALLIIPKLMRCVRRRRERNERTGVLELLLRLNYMASVFWSSLCVLCRMVTPFSGHLVSPLTYVIAIPYFTAMAVDLRYRGYKTLDALRIYGFNLLLLPVNLAGSLSSVVQALTGSKGRLMRIPKVRNRAVPAFVYVVLPSCWWPSPPTRSCAPTAITNGPTSSLPGSTRSSASTRFLPSSGCDTRSSTSGSTSSRGSTSRSVTRRHRHAGSPIRWASTTRSATGSSCCTWASPTAAAPSAQRPARQGAGPHSRP